MSVSRQKPLVGIEPTTMHALTKRKRYQLSQGGVVSELKKGKWTLLRALSAKGALGPLGQTVLETLATLVLLACLQ